jgi:hypothetical protein
MYTKKYRSHPTGQKTIFMPGVIGKVRYLHCVSTRTHTHARARAHTHTHTHGHAHTHTHTHTYTHAFTQIHTHTHSQVEGCYHRGWRYRQSGSYAYRERRHAHHLPHFQVRTANKTITTHSGVARMHKENGGMPTIYHIFR